MKTYTEFAATMSAENRAKAEDLVGPKPEQELMCFSDRETDKDHFRELEVPKIV